MQLVKAYGTTVVIGSRGPIEIMPRSIMARSSNIVGIMAGTTMHVDDSIINARSILQSCRVH